MPVLARIGVSIVGPAICGHLSVFDNVLVHAATRTAAGPTTVQAANRDRQHAHE